MNWQNGITPLKRSAAYIVLSGAVFLVCMLFTYYPTSKELATGITFSADLEIVELPWCSVDMATCEFNSGKLQIGDRVIKVSDMTKEQWESDRRLVLFGDFGPGDVVPITFERDGEEITIEWEMLHPNTLSRSLTLVVPLFIFGPFWLVGTLLLFTMLPHDSRWRIQLLFYYLTALWLAVGLQSATGYAYSSLILHALSWLLIPVFVHFHVIIPAPIFQHGRRQILPLLYAIAALLALLELTQSLPSLAFLLGVMVAIVCSIVLLAHRSLSRTQSAERVSARIMFAGIAMALGPGMLLWILPTLIGAEVIGEIATALTILSIPLLPLFYGYAVYKRRLGLQETRVNHFFGQIWPIHSVFNNLLGCQPDRWISISIIGPHDCLYAHPSFGLFTSSATLE